MPFHRRVRLHARGPAYWPEQKPLAEVENLRDHTPPHIWRATYQGIPSAPGGAIFKRSWWEDKNRYFPDDPTLWNKNLRRWISCDTAGSLAPNAAYSALVVAELTREYRLVIREVVRKRWEFPELLSQVTSLATRWSFDNKLSAVIIEAKSSGLPLIQTIQTQGEPWLAKMIWRYDPTQDKPSRAKYAATWCDDNRGCVLLPYPSEATPWLLDYEDELFNYSGADGDFADQVDATSQLILRVEHYLQRGYQARRRWAEVKNRRLGIRTTPALAVAR